MGILKNWKKKSISFYLFFLLFISSISAVLVGRQAILTVESLAYQIYISFALYVLFSSFNSYYDVSQIDTSRVSLKWLARFEKCIQIPSFLVILIDIYILITILPHLVAGYIVVNEFKNEGGVDSMAMFSSSVPHVLITLTNLFSPLGYICLSMHFYYLISGKVKKALIFLGLSMCIPFSGLISLSRSSTASYILLYMGMLFLFYPRLERRIKSTIRNTLITVGSAIIIVFLIISASKFGEIYSKKSENRAYISEMDNPTLYSLFDYCGQWQELSIKPLTNYDSSQLGFGLYNSFGLGVHVLKEIYGAEYINEYFSNKMYYILNHDEWYGFHGSITMTILDFGYLGTLLFVYIFSRILRRNRPRGGVLSMKSLLIIPLMLPYCVTFFSGNAYSSIVLDMGIIFTFIIWEFIKYRKKKSYVLTTLD